MNRVEFNDDEDPLEDSIFIWYLRGVSNSFVLPKFKIDEAVESFLTNVVDCLPRFSLIVYSKELEHVVERTRFQHPAVFIKQGAMSIHSAELTSEIDNRIEASSIPDDYWKSEGVNPTIYSFLQILHINGPISGLKITVTDWSDLRSPRPNASDPECPIKSVLFFADNLEGTEKMRRILSTKVKPTFTGGIIKNGKGEQDSAILLNDSKTCRLHTTKRITIAFAGKEVKSATLQIYRHYLGPSLEQQLEDFRQSLDFPIDDGRVVGFFFDMDWFETDSMIPKISTIFANVALVRLVMWKIFNVPTNDHPEFVLHLIRY